MINRSNLFALLVALAMLYLVWSKLSGLKGNQ